MFFEDWDIEGLSGLQTVNIYGMYFTKACSSAVPPQYPMMIGQEDATGKSFSRTSLPVRVDWAAGIEWQNHIYLTELDPNPLGGYEFSLTRIIDGKYHQSDCKVYNNEEIIFTDSSTTDIVDRWYSLGSITQINIESPTGRVYKFPVVGGVDPGDPGDPSTATVILYVRNSQTGALISGAQAVVAAGFYDPAELIEVSNTTLAGGTKTYTLQPTGGGLPNPDYYRVSVTADGYNSEMPYADITLDAGIPMTMVLGMQPTGGAPEDPGDTYIDVYVRDIYANPIADATVKLDRYILQTNSAGYTLFDVPVNSTYTYTVKKTGYTSIEGSVTVGDAARYPVNIVMGVGVIPTNPPITEPTVPGATPTPDHRTNEQKGQAVIDMIADNAEGIGALALICLLLGLLKLMVKW
jgi:hypothetical protein